jgi:hypothetical protein
MNVMLVVMRTEMGVWEEKEKVMPEKRFASPTRVIKSLLFR